MTKDQERLQQLIARALYDWRWRLDGGRHNMLERLDDQPESLQYNYLNQAEFVVKALSKADLLK